LSQTRPATNSTKISAYNQTHNYFISLIYGALMLYQLEKVFRRTIVVNFFPIIKRSFFWCQC
jgi:hypothetical protein